MTRAEQEFNYWKAVCDRDELDFYQWLNLLMDLYNRKEE